MRSPTRGARAVLACGAVGLATVAALAAPAAAPSADPASTARPGSTPPAAAPAAAVRPVRPARPAIVPPLARATGEGRPAAAAAGPGEAAAPAAASPAPARPATRTAAPSAPSAPASAAPQDPLELVRDKLVQRLGATGAPRPDGTASRHTLHVSPDAPGELSIVPGSRTSPRSALASPARPAVARARAAAPPAAAPAASAASADSPARSGPSWSYTGDSGPEHWARLNPDFELCASGRWQSPIDLRDGFAVDLEPVVFDYRPVAFTVTDTDHTLQVGLAPGNHIELDGSRYALQQLLFRHPGEEWVEGRRAEMSAHLVHRDDQGRVAIVAVPLSRGAPRPALQTVWNHLPLVPDDPVTARTPLDPGELLPDDRRYFTYMGSLTTPPCTEGVRWVVLKTPVQVSEAQIRFFARLHPMNARPVQAAAGRIVKQSN